MPAYYLKSGATGDADGSSWVNAFTTLSAALTAASAGDTIYVSQAHDETNSETTLDLVGTMADPVRILCVNDSGSPGALTTGASWYSDSTSGCSAYGVAHIYGVKFIQRRVMVWGGSSSVLSHIVFDTCTLETVDSATTYQHRFGNISSTSNKGGRFLLRNTRFGKTASAAYHGLALRNAHVEYVDTANGLTTTSGASGAFCLTGSACYSTAVFSGLDLSDFGSGTALVDVSEAGNFRISFVNCRLGSSVAITTGTIVAPENRVEVINCNSSTANYSYEVVCYEGTISSNAVNVRSGGATDGTTTVSRKLVSTANACYELPLVMDCNVQWNATTGSELTATCHIMTDGVTLKDNECWLEVEYLGSASYPISSLADDSSDILASGSNQTTSTETWDETDITSAVKQKLEVAFTPNMKGPIRCRVMLAAPEKTVYVCPKVEVA